MKIRFWIILLVFLGILFIWTRTETAKANPNVKVLKLELGTNVEDFHTINLFHYGDRRITLVTFHRLGKKYVIIHKYSRFKKDKIIFLLPKYKVREVCRQDLLSLKNQALYFKAIE